MSLPITVQGAWLIGAILFIIGLKGMSSPVSARKGIVWAGYGMLIAIAGTYRTSETPLPPEVTGKPAQISLQGEKLVMQGL